MRTLYVCVRVAHVRTRTYIHAYTIHNDIYWCMYKTYCIVKSSNF